jgi:hypothetical protein
MGCGQRVNGHKNPYYCMSGCSHTFVLSNPVWICTIENELEWGQPGLFILLMDVAVPCLSDTAVHIDESLSSPVS